MDLNVNVRIQISLKQLDRAGSILLRLMHTIIHGDFREVCSEIPDNSLDLIFTDPPYLKKNIHLYGDLGAFAAHKLKEGGSLVTYVGHYNLPDYIHLLNHWLTYWWIFSVKLQCGGFPMNHRHVCPKFKPLLWYVRGRYMGKYVYDHIESKYEGKKLHKWQQSTVEAEHFISRLTNENDTVCDPFLGSGTTGLAALKLGRDFIGIEIDSNHIEIAKTRLNPLLKQSKLP